MYYKIDEANFSLHRAYNSDAIYASVPTASYHSMRSLMHAKLLTRETYTITDFTENTRVREGALRTILHYNSICF